MIISGGFLGEGADKFYFLKIKKIYFNLDEDKLAEILNNNKKYFIILTFEYTLKDFNFPYKFKDKILYLKNIVLEIEDIKNIFFP